MIRTTSKMAYKEISENGTLRSQKDIIFSIINDTTKDDKDFGITLSNRGGMMKNAVHKINPLTKSLKALCYIPSYTFFLDYNGDVLMCPHDWGKKRILGNLKFSTFKEIWTSKLSSLSRKELTKGNRNFSPCNVCDVGGTLMGKKHANAWKTKQ